MRPTDYWPLSSRIVEIGATDGALGRGLVEAGYTRYLAVARDDECRASILRRHANLDRHVAVSASRKVVSQNNADVLILNGWPSLQLARFRAVRHARFVAWPVRPGLICAAAIVVAVVHALAGNVSWPRVVWCESARLRRTRGATRRLPLAVCRVRRPRPYVGVRRFIPFKLGVAKFFRRLQQQDVRYAVLRWFESLPDVAAGEDLDLLVADSDIEQVRSLLDEGPGIQAVDLYSVTGLPGADFQGMPYYPPHLADELLARSGLHKGRYRVPSPREHFLSLAYHALYHKGAGSGLPHVANEVPSTAHRDHDYAAVLRHLAKRAGFDSPINLTSLDALLDSVGWRPPHDMLVRLARRNHWVRSLLRKSESTASSDDRLAVFLLREEALLRGGIERAATLLQQHGFQILATQRFDSYRQVQLARTIRGGNWGRGPWPLSGGPPVAAIAVYDPAPVVPNRRERRRFPFLANARLLCKEQLRECFNEGLPAEQHCNVIHSSDNGREALDYLRLTMPHRVEDLMALVATLPKSRAAA